MPTHYNRRAFPYPDFMTSRTSPSFLTRTRLWLLALILGSCALVASTYHHFRATWDEPEHLAAGVLLLDRGLYYYDTQHPPLARLAMALGPWLAGAHSFGTPGPSGEQEGRDILYDTGNYDLMLSLARLGMLPFWVVLVWSTYAWGRHVHGAAAGLLAAGFIVTTPPLLGHAGVAALDIPGAATWTLAMYCLLLWFERQSWRHALLAGCAAGLAIATKLSNLPFIALVGLVWLLAAWVWRDSANAPSRTVANGAWWRQSIGILLIALLCVMLTYGWRFGYRVSDAAPVNAALDYAFGTQGGMHEAAYALFRHVPLPPGIEGLILSIKALSEHNAQGHWSYLLGKVSNAGFVQFYVVALAVKTPLPLLVSSCAGFVYLLRSSRRRDGRGWVLVAPIMAFVTVLAFCSFYSHINIGLRHVFVLFPCMAIAAAAWWIHLWQRHAQLAPRALLGAALAWQASSLWAAYPDYLAYFNVTAGKQPEKILIDSDLDWGQDLKRLSVRLRQLNIERIGLVYRGTADVLREDLPTVWMPQPNQPATGWLAVSLYARDVYDFGHAYAWLHDYTPRERIGKSFDLYFIPPNSSLGATAPPR